MLGREVIIITAEDCLHCIELEAILAVAPLSVAHRFIEKGEATSLFADQTLFLHSIDVLPFAGIFDDSVCTEVIRAATRERLEEALLQR